MMIICSRLSVMISRWLSRQWYRWDGWRCSWAALYRRCRWRWWLIYWINYIHTLLIITLWYNWIIIIIILLNYCIYCRWTSDWCWRIWTSLLWIRTSCFCWDWTISWQYASSNGQVICLSCCSLKIWRWRWIKSSWIGSNLSINIWIASRISCI